MNAVELTVYDKMFSKSFSKGYLKKSYDAVFKTYVNKTTGVCVLLDKYAHMVYKIKVRNEEKDMKTKRADAERKAVGESFLMNLVFTTLELPPKGCAAYLAL